MKTVDGMFFFIPNEGSDWPSLKGFEPGWYFWGAYTEEVGPYKSLEQARKGLDHYLESI